MIHFVLIVYRQLQKKSFSYLFRGKYFMLASFFCYNCI